MFLANDASLSRLQMFLPSHWSASVSPTSAVVFPPFRFKFSGKIPVQLYVAVRQEFLSCKLSLILKILVPCEPVPPSPLPLLPPGVDEAAVVVPGDDVDDAADEVNDLLDAGTDVPGDVPGSGTNRQSF